MNGDNNLTDEVLHAVDMMESVGSSKHLTILAQVDGRRNSRHEHGKDWETARLLYITQDDQIGVKNSLVLMEFGELDLGDPQTLEDFITTCLRFPADRYVPSPMATRSSKRPLWSFRVHFGKGGAGKSSVMTTAARRDKFFSGEGSVGRRPRLKT
ncbi:MAG: hypothetical protein U5R30_19750 [Deltaproteobacteria bacterium]|nr:hypothetical protein [Deltaproteobacteria bacterium]